MNRIVKFNVRGCIIETDIEPLLFIPYFKGINECRTVDECIFVDLLSEALMDVINFIKFPNYKISLKNIYLFDYFLIDIVASNISEPNLKKCLKCNQYTNINNYKLQGDFCMNCVCSYYSCIVSRTVDKICCDNHICKVPKCINVQGDRSDYCKVHQCQYYKCVNPKHGYCKVLNCAYTKCTTHDGRCRDLDCDNLGSEFCSIVSHRRCQIDKCKYKICSNNNHKQCYIITDDCCVARCKERKSKNNYCAAHQK